jgi:hypothetical protein
VTLEWVTNPLWLIINALAAYRLTRLWVADMLPPMPGLRDLIQNNAHRNWDVKGIEPDSADPEKARKWIVYGGTPPLAYLVTCAWCSGYWISLAVFLAASLIPTTVWAFLAVPLAFSAVVGLLHQATE